MPRPTYTSLTKIIAKLPHADIVAALDDNKDGEIDPEVWQAVAEDAADQVDSRLGKRYSVPFDPADPPPIVAASSLLFVLETLYQRRGFGTEETNPFLVPARAARTELAAIGNGEAALTPQAQKPKQSAKAVTEPAKTSSAFGHLSA